MNWDTVPQDMEALRQQVAALTQERDEVLAQVDLWKTAYGGADIKLAASQAREAKLREALEFTAGRLRREGYSTEVIEEALALPTDTSALDARLAEERALAYEATMKTFDPFTDYKGNTADPFDYDVAVNDLIDEVTALRRGVAITHTGIDPLEFFKQPMCGPLSRQFIADTRKRLADRKRA